MSELALSGSFEFQCYGYIAIINILFLPLRGLPLYVKIDSDV